MKLIKINTDHYVVVDETIQPVNDYYYDSSINKIKNTNGAEYGEASHCWQITHSTKGKYKQEYISLEEVKELIGEVDVTTKAVKDIEGTSWDEDAKPSFLSGYLRGYRHALEDNKEKKYTEEDVINLFKEFGIENRNVPEDESSWIELKSEHIEEWIHNKLIQSLQPKTEWEVEIVDGKLKLKL